MAEWRARLGPSGARARSRGIALALLLLAALAAHAAPTGASSLVATGRSAGEVARGKGVQQVVEYSRCALGRAAAVGRVHRR
jgi:hypothetical protein